MTESRQAVGRRQADFVGRQAELLLLRQRLSDALRGLGSTVVVHGEAGLGKTRLLDELAATAADRGATLLRAGVEPTRQDVAYGLIAGLLRGYLDHIDVTELDELRQVVAELVPHLWPTLFPQSEPPPPAETPLPGESQQSLFPARLTAILLARAQHRPLVLCVEDLHSADAASRQLVLQLASRSGSAPLLVVLALRPEAADDGLRRELQELGGREHVHRLDLAPLTEAEARQLVSSSFDREGFTPELFVLLHRRSRGVPLYLVEYLESLLQDGALYRERDLWQNRRLREEDMPASVKAAIQKRINGLSPEDRELLCVAAVQGDTFEGALLATLMSQPVAPVLRRLTSLVSQTRLLRSHGRGFAFGHPVVAETFYQQLSQTQRRHLHSRLANQLAIERPEASEALAYHFFRGGVYPRALPLLVTSAHRAMHAGAFREARIYLTQALEASEHVADCRPVHLDVLLTLAEAESLLGEIERSLELCRQALSEAGRDSISAAVARAWKQMGWAHFRRSAFAEAQDCYDAALRLYTELDDRRNSAVVEMRLGHLAFESSDLDTASFRYRHAREQAAASGDHNLAANVDLSLGVVASVRGEHAEAILSYSAALRAYRDKGDRYGTCQSFHNLGMTHAAVGSWDTALRCYRQAVDIAEQLGVEDLLANVLVSQAVAQVRSEELEAADLSQRRSAALMQELGDRLGLAECAKVAGMVCAARGQLEEAARRLEESALRFQQLDNALGEAECEQELGLVWGRRDDAAAARAHLERALQLYRGLEARREAAAVEALLHAHEPSLDAGAA